MNGIGQHALMIAFCGALLVLYALYALVAVMLTALFWRKETAQITASENAAGSAGIAGRVDEADSAGTAGRVGGSASRAGEAGSAAAHLFSPREQTLTDMSHFPPCVPGTTVLYVLELALSPARAVKAEYTIAVPLQAPHAAFETVSRGRYFYKRRELRIVDFAGFYAFSFVLPPCEGRTYTVVEPLCPCETAHIAQKMVQPKQQQGIQESTHELSESRPYFPGDDPRKIHWKLFAHTHTLSVKLGTFEPPRVRHITVYIEEPCVNKKGREAVKESFNAFIGRLSHLLVKIAAQGLQCTILLQDYPAYALNEQCKEDTLFRGATPGSVSLRDSTQSATQAAIQSKPRVKKSLQHYSIHKRSGNFSAELQRVLAIPSLCTSIEDALTPGNVFSHVQNGSMLMYCYLPLGSRNIGAEGKNAGSLGIEEKIAACRRSRVETVFVLGRFLQRLLSSDSGRTRKEAVAAAAQKAAEQDMQIFTEGKCHAELL